MSANHQSRKSEDRQTDRQTETASKWTKDGHELIGSSEAIAEVKAQITHYATVDATVCIVGETGVGKNLAARLIHEQSSRQGGPFVKVDCTHIGSELWMTECLGSVRGGFTGATDRMGLFKSADGGTLFIDEVQDLTPDHQGKLRDFVDRQGVRPVGSTRSEKVNVRIILGMNQNPCRMVQKDRLFRFYRKDYNI
jgi:DNA-binding NtrC family response regulator